MRRLVPLLAVLLAAPVAYTQAAPAQGPCLAMDELNLYDPDRPGELFTTPSYVALAASGNLRRVARRSRPLRREVALSDEQSACLEGLTGARMTAVRAGSSYRFKLQTAASTLLIFHVDDLVGSEAIVPTQAERLLADAERFFKEGNRAEAAKAYREALKAEPRPVEAAKALTALGRMEKEEGRWDEALEHFRKAVEAYPRYVPALEEQAALAQAIRLSRKDAVKFVREGTKLRKGHVKILEKKLKTNSEDLSARTKLLGFYSTNNSVRIYGLAATIEARRRHIFWLIRHHPASEIFVLLEATINPIGGAVFDPIGHVLADKEGYEQAKGLWLEQADIHKENTSVLGNAATFFQLHDKDLAESMLKRAQAVGRNGPVRSLDREELEKLGERLKRDPDDKEAQTRLRAYLSYIRWSPRLGYLYALGILRVNGLNRNGLPTSLGSTEADFAFAKKARRGLEQSSDAGLLATAGKILYQYGGMVQAMVHGRKLEPETWDFAEGLLKKAQALEPENPGLSAMLEEFYEMKRELFSLPEKN